MKLITKSALCFLQMVMVSILLIGCGGGSEDSSTNPSIGQQITDDYFPLETGSRWIFDVTVSDSWASTVRYLSSQVVAGAATVSGQNSQLIRNVNPENGDQISLDYMVKTPNAVSAYFEDNTPPIDIVHLPLRQGDHFVQVNRKNVDVGVDYDGDGINETMSLFLEVTVMGFEEVQTPAGLFTHALKVQGQGTGTYYYSRDKSEVVVKHSTSDWYVDGVGQVKKIEILNAPDRNLTTTHILKSYKVGSRTNDVVQPSIIQVSPAEGSLQGGLPVVRIQFSENIDVRTFNPVNITLRDASGQSIQGDINFVNQVLTFTPKQALASGRFTFYVGDTIGDLLGNALSKSLTLNFNVDAEAPSVVANMPLTDDEMVPLDSIITLDFNEELDPATIDADSIQLLMQGANTLIESSVSVKGKRVTLTPKNPLARETRYVVVVSTAVKDPTGNAIPEPYRFKFRSDSGLFKPYQTIYAGSNPEAVAIGDVNGDGRNDVVMTTSFYVDAANDYKLMVFLQQADGSLAPPVKYALLSSDNCLARSVAIADVDGDGKPEVVVGEGNCGIEVLGRNAAGNWISRGQLPSNDGYKVRTADLNNDGKQDIVGAGWGTGTISVWYQGTDGKLNNPVSYPLAHSGWEDLKVGDMNSDGLSDIVVHSGPWNQSTALAYVQQLSAGGFSSPQYLDISAADFHLNIGAIAVGDVNDDALSDLVMAVGGSRPDSKLGLFMQESSGRLAPMTMLPIFDMPNAMEIGDVDNNGHNDILVLHNGGGTLSLYRQMLDGSLAAEEFFGIPFGTGANSHGLAVGDINSDGYTDVVMSDRSGNLAILYNNSAKKVAATNKTVAVSRGGISVPKLESALYNTKFKAKSFNILMP